ncbi:MAG: hypothetical protein H6735_27305 [Alphaproteobacteria bacterium]|nr:hypothetical protein [Alphaproteobacteria bacterium]
MLPLIGSLAWAYETDQLTWRDRPLADADERLDTLLDALLAEAVARTNERTACEGDDETVRDELAAQIQRATSHRAWVWRRGLLRAPGFSRYTRQVLLDPDIERFDFDHREDLYGGLNVWHSVVLATAGPCTTLQVAGVRLGDDKLDHFLDNGYHYYVDARKKGVEHAIEVGTRTERAFYGLLTSKAFSYGDLRANWDGYRFFAGLLDEGSVFARDDRGCVVQERPFAWSEWVGPEWDELLNPPIYTRNVERGVLRDLERDADEVCAARERWDVDGWREEALSSLPAPAYVAERAPARRDPWQLEALCDPTRTERLEPAEVRPRREMREWARSAH